ncbi:MAG TPA: DUF6484 domain-containing protein [Gemmataceae bacterium]|nr:DUF6484 domain-containing protein [Gemmataceae bacterium]
MPAPMPQAANGLAAEELLTRPSAPPRIDGVVVATLAAFDDGGAPRVTFPGNPLRRPVSARSTVALDAADVGRDLAVSFEQGDPSHPIILGKLWHPEPAPATVQVAVDNERLVLTAEKEIVFQCGASSITLTKAGKVLIRGAYLLSRSSGVNRIKGGSVQIN